MTGPRASSSGNSRPPHIATLTLNPSIDVAYEVEALLPTQKMRCEGDDYEPGGGGINVARVVTRLGGKATCYYLSGGVTGVTLDKLLLHQQFERRPIPIAGHTRICFNTLDRSSGLEYRFVPNGPQVTEAEWHICLEAMESVRCDVLVASGSLPHGIPPDFYRRVGEVAKRRGFAFVLDTSGEALKQGLEGGGADLIKPSETELAALVGRKLESIADYSEAARSIVEKGQAKVVAATLGARGAVLATSDGVEHLPAMDVKPRSAVGAGDSFTAAMVVALAKGWPIRHAFRYGLAAGSAAVTTPGTEMCRAEDVERLYAELTKA